MRFIEVEQIGSPLPVPGSNRRPWMLGPRMRAGRVRSLSMLTKSSA
jgi:hypothetical protein